MMSTSTLEERKQEQKARRAPLRHKFCGNCYREDSAAEKPPVPFCGLRKPNWTMIPLNSGKPAEWCVVCADLYEQPCPRCGSLPKDR